MKTFGLLLIVATPFILSHENETDTGCPEWSTVCHRDCCFKNVQFCNEEEERCTKCDRREHQCGTPLEPVGCELFCHRLLHSTTTTATTTVSATTPTSAPQTTEENEHVRLPQHVILIIISVVGIVLLVLLVACGVYICMILRKRKAKRQKGKEDPEAELPLTESGEENTASKSCDRPTHPTTGNRNGSGRSSTISTTSEEADPDKVAAEVRRGQTDSDSAGDPVQDSVRDDGPGPGTEATTRQIPTTAAPDVTATSEEHAQDQDRNIGGNARTPSPEVPGEPPPARGRQQPGDQDVSGARGGPSSNLHANAADHDTRRARGVAQPASTDTHAATAPELAIEMRQPYQDGNHQYDGRRLDNIIPTHPHQIGPGCITTGTEKPTRYIYNTHEPTPLA